jgi:uncharacterized protein
LKLKPIKISTATISLTAELNDSPTARAIHKALPIESVSRRWGDEVYFDIPVKCELEPQAKSDMAVGEIAYWPPGNAFCVFFGPTPASKSKLPRAAGPVNPIGNIAGDATQLRAVKDGEKIRIEHL